MCHILSLSRKIVKELKINIIIIIIIIETTLLRGLSVVVTK